MKHLTFLLALILVFGLTLTTSMAGTTTHTYFFSKPRVEVIQGQTTVILDGTLTWGQVGEPLLPYSPVRLLLPPGEEAVSISVKAAEPLSLGYGYQIPPRQRPIFISFGPPVEPTPPNPAVYSSDYPYPATLAGGLQTQFLLGHGIAYAVIYPVSYRPVSGELNYYPWITVTVKSLSTQRAQNAHTQMLKRTRFVQERLARKVQNPETIPLYGTQIPTRPDHWDMLLITPQAFVDGYQEYVNYKNRSGILTVVETVEDIYDNPNYNGIDNQDEIRNCIIDYNTNLGVTHVFLCGDHENVPSRILWGPGNEYYNSDCAGDVYYAGLDGNWNADGDETFGEPGEADLEAEVFVGRSCADVSSEISNVVNKTLMYQTQPVVEELERALMAAEDLGFEIWAWEYKDEIRYGSSNWGYTTVGFPANFTVDVLYSHPGYCWSPMEDLLPLLNEGPNLYNHMGHGQYDHVMQLDLNQINDDNFTNNGVNHNFFIGYTQACLCGGFDYFDPNEEYDVMLEAFTTIVHGAVAFVGNSRGGVADYTTTNGVSQHYDREFFDALFGEAITTLGWMNQDSKEDNIPYVVIDEFMRFVFYELNLFGDPTLDVWTAEPAAFFPAYNSVVLLGAESFQVSNISVPGALVTISMSNEVLGQGEANASGVAIVDFDQPLTQLGMLDLMITAHNMLPYQGEIEVIPNSGAYVIYSNCQIEDAITGNGNGQLDFGEAVELTMWVANVGVESASNVDLTISSSDPLVTITDDEEHLGYINPGAIAILENAFAFEIGSDVEDGYGLEFTLLAISGATNWESNFAIEVHAPEAEYTSHYIDDTATGNSNHDLDPDEEAIIEVTITNDGTSNVDNLIMTLSTTDPYIVVSESPVNLGLVRAGESAMGNYTIEALPSCPDEHEAVLDLAFTGDGGYVSNDDFSITVADALYDPTGPDEYGYSAYDPYDAPEYPEYRWIEICAELGGPGVEVPFIYNNQVRQYDLPFTFRYYGNDYDVFTISTDGWIAMGEVTEVDPTNSSIPDLDGPPNMIAPYWEDLSPLSENSDRVWLWEDENNHQLIVEYCHVEQNSPEGYFETFQVVLLDPEYYPTNTGDGRIIFHYKEMSARVQIEGTIGIENFDQDVGIQYLFDGEYDIHAHPIEDGTAIMVTTPYTVPDIVITLTPYGTPIQIPASGGSFDYNLEVVNNEDHDYSGHVWCDVTRPDSSTYGPTLGPEYVYLEAGFVGDRDRTQSVPANAPAGQYIYHGYVGYYPDGIWSTDSFPFEKLPTGDGPIVEGWVNTGEPFDAWFTTMDKVIVPHDYSLDQNYPNPFNPLTTINFGLPKAACVSLKVYDISGRLVTTVLDGFREPGYSQATFDGSDLASGIYLVRLDVEGLSLTRKMILMK